MRHGICETLAAAATPSNRLPSRLPHCKRAELELTASACALSRAWQALQGGSATADGCPCPSRCASPATYQGREGTSTASPASRRGPDQAPIRRASCRVGQACVRCCSAAAHLDPCLTHRRQSSAPCTGTRWAPLSFHLWWRCSTSRSPAAHPRARRRSAAPPWAARPAPSRRSRRPHAAFALARSQPAAAPDCTAHCAPAPARLSSASPAP
mmetsp:Transcript_46253/g.128548  ORF Transcript_46253/g.128548 Transcript_46253/m.128548 type:complete len:212 (-) Transcript_46253:517-1152(-)